MTQIDIVDPRISKEQATVAGSNSLPELAARIRKYHEETAGALRRSIEHGIAAGELLIEAKQQLKHGEWLPWLRDNCAMSERTAQLYMRLAKNREEIETKSAAFADLNINEVAALLMLSSDVRKVLNFARDCENLSAAEVIERCIANGTAVFHSPGYDTMAGRSEAEKLEWHLFILFQSFDRAAGRGGGDPQHVADNIEWILQRPFQSVAEWLGPEGDSYRDGYRASPMPDQFKVAWSAFLDQHRDWTQPDVTKKLESLQREFQQAPPSQPTKRRRSKMARR